MMQIGEEKLSGIRGLIGSKMSKQVKFMGKDVTIYKLSVAQYTEMRDLVKRREGENAENVDDLEMVRFVISNGVEGGAELTDEDFRGFPMEELEKLTFEIMKYSGMAPDQKGKSS